MLTTLAARPDPRPGGRAGQGHDDQGGDRGRRAARRRARARRRSSDDATGASSISDLPGPEVGRRDGGDPAQHGRRARARAAARAAAGQGHPVLASCAPRSARRWRHELRAVRRAGVPAGGRARRARRAFKTVEAAREALDGGELPDLWPTARRGRLARPADLRGARRRRARRDRGDARVRRARPRARRASPLLGHLPATFLLDARRRRPDCSSALATRRAARRVRAGPAAGRRRRSAGRSSRGAARRARAGARGRAATARVSGDGRAGCPTRRAPTCSWSWSARTGRARARRRPARRVAIEPVDALRRHAPARPRRASTARPATRARRGAEDAAGAPGTSRQALLARRVARRGRASRSRCSVAYAKERFTFGRAIGSYQAVKHALVGDPAAARERPLAHVLRRLGGARTSPTSSRSPRPRSGSRRARRSTTPRARRSPSTAASARRGSTTRRCTSAARSSRGGCSAGTPTRPTAWPASC